jgi:hypothetical protein
MCFHEVKINFILVQFDIVITPDLVKHESITERENTEAHQKQAYYLFSKRPIIVVYPVAAFSLLPLAATLLCVSLKAEQFRFSSLHDNNKIYLRFLS